MLITTHCRYLTEHHPRIGTVYSQRQVAQNTPTSIRSSRLDNNNNLATWLLTLGACLASLHTQAASSRIQNIAGPHVFRNAAPLMSHRRYHIVLPPLYCANPAALPVRYIEIGTACASLFLDTATCYSSDTINATKTTYYQQTSTRIALPLPPITAPALLGIRMSLTRLPRYHMTDRSSALFFGPRCPFLRRLFIAVSSAAELVPSPWVICFIYFERARDWQPGRPCTTNRRRLRSHFSLHKS